MFEKFSSWLKVPWFSPRIRYLTGYSILRYLNERTMYLKWIFIKLFSEKRAAHIIENAARFEIKHRRHFSTRPVYTTSFLDTALSSLLVSQYGYNTLAFCGVNEVAIFINKGLRIYNVRVAYSNACGINGTQDFCKQNFS